MNVATRQAVILSPRPEIPNSVRNNLLAYYSGKKLNGWNNATDKKWYDSSGNGRHADMVNLAYTGNSNLDAYGFNVDGVDDFATIADSAATRLTGGGTLFVWIKPVDAGEVNVGRIFDKSTNATGGGGYMLRCATTNRLVVYVNNGTPLVSTDNAFTARAWQLVAVTIDSSGRALYVNAVNKTNTGGSETALPPNTVGSIAIGNRAEFTDATFNGQIDRAGICNRALSQAEIYQIYMATRRFYT